MADCFHRYWRFRFRDRKRFSFVYSTNMVAIVMVMIFAIIAVGSLIWTKSIIPMMAVHSGNNFFGALLSISVVGLSAFGTTSSVLTPFLISFIFLGIAIALIALIIFWVRKHGKK